MKRFAVAIFISALALLSISGAAQARFNPQVISTGGAPSARDLLERMTLDPASVALLGAGLLVIGGVNRRRRSQGNTGSRIRSLNGALYLIA